MTRCHPLLIPYCACPQVHGLTRLRHLTETLLVGMVARSNCGMMLAQADKLKATELRKAAMQVILNEFDSLRPADLADVDSSLMAEIYRGRTNFPIHLAVTTGREVRRRTDAAIARAVVANLPWMDSFCEPTAAAQDVVFLFLLDAAMQRRIDDLNEDSTAATIMEAACARPLH